MGNIQCCGLSIQQIKNEIQAHQQALLALSNVTHGGTGHGTGILIHRALVLTSHEAFPTHTSAGEISVQDDRAATPRTVLTRRLFPSRLATWHFIPSLISDSMFVLIVWLPAMLFKLISGGFFPKPGVQMIFVTVPLSSNQNC